MPLRKTSQSRPPHPGTSREMPIVPPKPTAQNSTTTPSATATRFTSSPPDPLSPSPVGSGQAPGARGTQTKRAPSEARANRGSEREQDRYRDDQLQEVSQQEGPGAELRGGPQVSRENRELREPAEVDEHQSREHTARHTPYARSVASPPPPPPPPLHTAERGNDCADRVRRDRIGQQISTGRPEQPRDPGERHRRCEHRQPGRAHRQIENHARGAERPAEQSADEQYGERLQRHRHGRPWKRDGDLGRDSNE